MSESESFHFCGALDVRAVRGAAAAWRKRELSYHVTGSLPGVAAQDFRDCAARAFAQWQEVTPLTFAPAAPGAGPDVVLTTGRIDGPYGVLAWSELPDGSDRQLTQKYDSSERYVIAERPAQGRIDLLAVMAHEIGHALGLDHAPAGAPDLMAPTYRPGLRTLQPGDVQRVQALYGKPSPPPPAPGPAPGRWLYELAVDRRTGEATLTRR